ncbi:DUF945 domain-containing protein [Guyparkeria sp. SCN-R1]|uniref:DUF945 family protein n=1 Tax=Guyparkeria sp. SCN-R1 TaxID=2341113 RepID=UPI000F65435F|nr:DUF945 family protein [Guyparkeria sp. SCN-R1]RRQ24622.1 DUF945 domain-containing protein [Guyparkeria sp. SCN-R1]
MKRLIITAVVVAVAILAAAPFVTGHVMERTLAEVEGFPGTRDALELEVTEYQRGYLESRAESELLLRLPEQEPVRVTLTHRIDQMPGIDGRYATVHTTWEPTDSELRDELAEVFGDDAEFTLATALYPTGSSHSTGRIPSVERDGVDFSGADIELDTTAAGRFDYRFEGERLAVDDEAGGVETGSAAVTEGLRLIASGQVAEDGFVWDSEGRFEIDRLEIVEANGQGQVEDFILRFDSARDEDQWGFAVAYEVGEAVIEDEMFRDAEMRLAVDRLDAAAVRALVERMETLQELASRGASIEKALSDAVVAELPALMSHGPRIAIEPLRATTAEGDTEITFAAELPAGVSKGEPNPMMWMAMLSALVIEGSLEMPIALLEKSAAARGQQVGIVEEQLAPLVAQGWVNVEDGVVTTTVDFRQGNLQLNGTSANQLLNMAFGS